MTREEAIANLSMIRAAYIEPVTKEQRKIIDNTFNIAINELKQEPITDRIEYGTDGNAYRLTISNGKEFKQEPILDKIRAEIVEMRSKQNVGVLECLDIIDKYRGE